MKEICRDFILSIEVPDDVRPEDCEIVIIEASASYTDSSGKSQSVPHGSVDISAEDPFLQED